MKAIIITIGDEILLGQILDTNSQYISRQLTRLGVKWRIFCLLLIRGRKFGSGWITR